MNLHAEFAEKVVWVTGAASGQGARHAHRYAEVGAWVGCLDLNAEGVERVAESVRRAGGRAEGVTADVSDWNAMAEAAETLKERLGPVDIVVANAGIVPPKVATVEDLDPGDWERVLAVNLTGVFHTVKAAIPPLRERPGGSIVLISSVAGIRGFPSYGSYVASKHGVIGLMRTLANELAAESIRVNAICPGTVNTPILDSEAANFGVSREVLVKEQIATHLIERIIEPDEISDAVLWLTSEAAQMVTGVNLPVDGGLLERCALT